MATFNASTFATGGLIGPNPFAMSHDPNTIGQPNATPTTTGVPLFQHGSFERYGVNQNPLGTYLGSMEGATPRMSPDVSPHRSPRASPRSSGSRGRSQVNGEDETSRSRERRLGAALNKTMSPPMSPSLALSGLS